ncbi:adenosylcobinamide-phosphate synthase CbiB [Pseudaestuariivita rosea]|uniref:adenosylcobinamide-phosphate synthase CbiB n=1 Tax=Pseudaestuariivita rosea TaxID=2763263 RepID=UPI001ABA6DE1
MTTAAVLVVALCLDAILGEPKWLWTRLAHPAVIMGQLIGWLEKRFNTDPVRRTKGIAVLCLLVLGAIALGFLLQMLGPIVQGILAAILLAQRSLVQHVRAVADELRLSLVSGRQAVSMIVGRDTSDMGESDVARAAIESAAENLSDGVIAPAFWFLVAGLPGLLVYKVTNTADSMIGHKTARYQKFGWAAARFDDVLNWVPARLTAALIAVSCWCVGAGRIIFRDAKLHRSVNAGWPEAAMAVTLNIALSGPRSYGGQLRCYQWVHPEGRRILLPSDIDRAVSVLWQTWFVFLLLVLILFVFSL